MSQAVAISVGSEFVGALCVIGAINQVRTGETWGLAPSGRLYRGEQPSYFWFLFVARALRGAIALIGGLLALSHLHANG